MISIVTSSLRFFYRAALLIGFMLLYLIPALMQINHYQRRGTDAGKRRAEAAAIGLAKRLVWVFGIRIQSKGLPANGPVLIAANHLSWLDILAMHSVRAMSFVAKAEIDQWPLFGYMARTGNTIFHQRGNHDSATDAAAEMDERLKRGERVAIYPEGGILPGISVRRFHARMFRAAVDAHCPVQPVMVRYMRGGQRDDDITFREGESMFRNICRLLARPGAHADIHFLPLIDTVGAPRRVLADAARAAVVESYDS